MRRHIDSGRKCLREALETAVVAAGLRQFVQSPLGILDLVAWRKVNGRIIGHVHHILADLNQRAAYREVIDSMAVIFSVDACCCFSSKPGKIMADGEPSDVDTGIKERFQRHRGRELSGPDEISRELIDLLVDRLEEMSRLKKIRYAVKSFVVDQNSTQQRLFRLDV